MEIIATKPRVDTNFKQTFSVVELVCIIHAWLTTCIEIEDLLKEIKSWYQTWIKIKRCRLWMQRFICRITVVDSHVVVNKSVAMVYILWMCNACNKMTDSCIGDDSRKFRQELYGNVIWWEKENCIGLNLFWMAIWWYM